MKKSKWIATLAGLSAVASTAAMAHVDAKTWGGLSVENKHDSAYSFAIGGRVEADETIFSGSTRDKGNNFPTGGNIRRAIVKLSGGVGDHMNYALSLRFNGTDTRFEDAWLGACAKYSGVVDSASVRVGQFTPATSMDNWGNFGTTNSNMFLESALATTAFAGPDKAYGIAADMTSMDMFTLSAAVYQPNQENLKNNFGDANGNDRVGASARLTYAPIHQDDKVVHFGVTGRYQDLKETVNGNDNKAAGFWTATEARGRNTNTRAKLEQNSVLNTGAIRAKGASSVAFEALGIMGPASVQAEYHQARINRIPLLNSNTPAPNPHFKGWHVQAGYMLTGEHRAYNFAKGTLHNPKPAAKCGAWEVAARHSYVNLNNKDIHGGSEHNTTLGVNWFVNENVRLAANYVRANVRTTNPSVAGTQPSEENGKKRQLDIFGLRVGLTF